MNEWGEMMDSCRALPARELGLGETLLEEGRCTGVLYVLEEGSVRITKEGHEIDTVSRPGAIFGEVSVLLEQPHMATVVAATPCRVRVIHDARAWLREHPELAFHLAHVLARRLNAVTGYLIDLKRQFSDRGDHLGMVDEVIESLLHLQAKPRR